MKFEAEFCTSKNLDVSLIRNCGNANSNAIVDYNCTFLQPQAAVNNFITCALECDEVGALCFGEQKLLSFTQTRKF